MCLGVGVCCCLLVGVWIVVGYVDVSECRSGMMGGEAGGGPSECLRGVCNGVGGAVAEFGWVLLYVAGCGSV